MFRFFNQCLEENLKYSGSLSSFVVIAAVPLLIASCNRPTSNFELSGSIVTDSWFAGSSGSPEGRDCDVYDQGDYRDLAIGTEVKVKDSAGEIIALGKINSGKVENLGGQLYCVMSFSVPDIPDSKFYAVSLGSQQRGELTYSKDELVGKNWYIELGM